MSTLFENGLVLITGGAASGKSALGERVCRALGGGGRLLYIAAMRPHGAEAAARIARHREQRQGLGFETLERYTDLAGAALAPGYSAALLEDTGNLVANEMFEAGVPVDAVAETAFRGIRGVWRRTGALVIIANEIFSGCERFDSNGEMAAYLTALGRLHCLVAAEAAVVVESVCGLPLSLKGELPL